MLCWNLPSSPKHRGWLQKKHCFPWRQQAACRWFRANLDQTNTDMVQFTKIWNCNGLPNINKTFAESLQLQMSVLHQRMRIFQTSMLVSQVHMMAGQIVKKKYLMCQIPIKILKQEATPKSRLQNLKIYLSKGWRKTSQRWTYICS